MSLARTLSVADLMRSTPFTLPSTLPVSDVARRIEAAGVRHVLVVDEAGRLVGLVNRARLLRHLVAQRLDSFHTPDRLVVDLLVPALVTIAPHALAAEAVRAMRRHRIGSLPVVDDAGRLVGLLSERMLLPFCETLLCGEPAAAPAAEPVAAPAAESVAPVGAVAPQA